MTTLIGFAIHKTMGMRVSEADELSGIDVTEHAETAYELLMVGGSFHPGDPHGKCHARGLPAGGQPGGKRTGARQGLDMKLVTAIVRPERVDAVSAALEELGVNGLTVSQASGYGRQRGHVEVYRGAEYNSDLLPKARVEVLVNEDVVDGVVDAILAVARTGRFGDGKIWTIDVRDAVRVRTGERGASAIA